MSGTAPQDPVDPRDPTVNDPEGDDPEGDDPEGDDPDTVEPEAPAEPPPDGLE